MLYKNNKKGFSLIEIVVGLAIIFLCMVSLFSALQISLRVINSDTQQIKAGLLLEEGIEAVKSMRAESWNDKIKTLATSTSYYFFFDDNNKEWQATLTSVYVDSFERKFSVEDVYRDNNDDITSSGTLDLNTKKVVVLVSWVAENGTTTDSLSAYITNLFNN